MTEAPKRFLNVGGNNKAIAVSAHFSGWEHLLLDIDAKSKPDIVGDARTMRTLPGSQFDAIYCSHNLEHYYHHEVPVVLTGFYHVLRDNGFVECRVPDIGAVLSHCVQKSIDLDDVLYVSPAGPIMVRDVLWGYGVEIQSSGRDFYAHKTGFTRSSIVKMFNKCGFPELFVKTVSFELQLMAFKQKPDPWQQTLLGLNAFKE